MNNMEKISKFRPYKYISSYNRKVMSIITNKEKSPPLSLPTQTNKNSTDLCVENTVSSNENDLLIINNDSCTIEEFNENFEQLSYNENVDELSYKDAFEQDNENVQCIQKQLDFMQDLTNWALIHKIKHCALNDLLKLLNCHGMKHLPKDSRTLLLTPRTVEIQEIGEGKYWYNGVMCSLVTLLFDDDNILKQCPSTISLIFNIDGIKPFKSNILEFWPILFFAEGVANSKPMVAAVYYGYGKPPLEPFLTPFVNELLELLKNGFKVKNFKFSIKIKCFICDTPARCYIKGIFLFDFLLLITFY